MAARPAIMRAAYARLGSGPVLKEQFVILLRVNVIASGVIKVVAQPPLRDGRQSAWSEIAR